MFFIPLLIGAGLVYFLVKKPVAYQGAVTGADMAANDVTYALPPGPGGMDAYEQLLLAMASGSSSQPPPWPPQEASAPDAAFTSYSALSTAPQASIPAQGQAIDQNLGTLYAAQDQTPIRAEPRIWQDDRGMFTVPKGYAMNVLQLDPSGWVHVELVHPDHGMVDGWTELRFLTAIPPTSPALAVSQSPNPVSPASSSHGLAPMKRPMVRPNQGAAKAAQQKNPKMVPVVDAMTGKVIGQRPRLNVNKRRAATPVTA